jgi:GNAT superfamily N-acetyltransferase
MQNVDDYRIEPFILEQASDQDLLERFTLEDLLMRERDPDAETIPHEIRLRILRTKNRPGRDEQQVWLVRAPDNHYVGIAWLDLSRRPGPVAEPDYKCCVIMIGVHPAHRGQGIATRLLKEIAQYADSHGYEMIEPIWETPTLRDRARFISARYAMNKSTYRIRLKNISWPMIERWVTESELFAQGATLERCETPLPEPLRDELLPLWWRAQDGHRRSLAELRHEWQRQQQARETASEDWLCFVVKNGHGKPVALLEAIYNPRASKVVLVRSCDVQSDARGQGYRRWLHGAFLLFLRDQMPKVEYVSYRRPPAGKNPAGLPPAIADPYIRIHTKELLRRLA